MRYQIRYYYLATGMEGRADVQDYGIHEARTPREACEKAAVSRHPDADAVTIAWIMGCLTAKQV